MIAHFDFRVLRQNRRVVSGEAGREEELEDFHQVLTDISWGLPTERVKSFIVNSYVRGAYCGCAENAELEGSTSVFTKRRFRDKWNRTLVRRIARTRAHSLKIKGRVRSRGARGQQWFSDSRTQYCRKKSRTQALWNLHLAGDWHPHSETALRPPARPHMMRTMLTSNLAVDQRFANGMQGRLLHWHPASVASKKAIPASHPELLARFAKESALSKTELLADLDHMDITARQETLVNIPGQPVLLQLPAVPCYALTVHKVQSLSIKHIVRGCLEGVFAQGQIYVLVSRVTDPRNFELLGLPPADLIDEIAAAWQAAGMDVVECLRRAASVTGEWVYTPSDEELRDRFTPRRTAEHTVPVKQRELWEILNPQPRAAAVLHRLLDWIDRVDIASKRDEPRPLFATAEGGSIWPEDDDPWWLTEMQRKTPKESQPGLGPGDEDGPAEEEGNEEQERPEDALTEDEDPSSESDADGVNDETLSLSQDVPRSSDWEPHLGWRGGKSAKPLSDSLVSTAAGSAESPLASLGAGSSSG